MAPIIRQPVAFDTYLRDVDNDVLGAQPITGLTSPLLISSLTSIDRSIAEADSDALPVHSFLTLTTIFHHKQVYTYKLTC
jgi:hypothetical protein